MRIYVKSLFGVGLSIAALCTGFYINNVMDNSVNSKESFSQEQKQENYIKSVFNQPNGQFYLSFHRSFCRENKLSVLPKCTMVVFTSLACHICKEFHMDTFPKILSSPLYKSGALRVIFVEYPADRVSFFASGYVWASEHVSEARNHLIQTQETWAQPLPEAQQLNHVRKILNTKKSLSQSELTMLFQKKMEAQKIFNITNVPLFVLYNTEEKQGNRIKTSVGEMSWKMFQDWVKNTIHGN